MNSEYSTNINDSTIQGWREDKTDPKELSKSKKRKQVRKISPNYPEMEKKLFEWFKKSSVQMLWFK